jgi:molecular chaperone DnaK
MATGKAQSIRIEASSGLNEEEIKKMVKDAQTHGAEDKRKREAVEVRNKADQLVYETEKNLKDLGDKLSADERGKLEAAIGRVKEALKGSDSNEIKSAADALTSVWSDAAKAMYEKSSAGAGSAGGPGAGGGPGPAGGAAGGAGQGGQGGQGGGRDDAVDADYEVVD